MRFTLTVAGDIQVDREIEAVSVHAEGLDQALRDIAVDLRKQTIMQFDTEGRHAEPGLGWRRLKTAYLMRKQAWVAKRKIINGRPAKQMEILRLTDRLKGSLVNKSDPEHVESVTNHTLIWGTRVPYAAAHQNARDPLKRRRFLNLPEERRQAYARGILTQIRTGKSGL